MRLDDFHGVIESEDGQWFARCALRRWYHDGSALGKFEVGFFVRHAPPNDGLRANASLKSLAEAILAVRVRIPVRTASAASAGLDVCPLGRAGPALAAMLVRASRPHRAGAAQAGLVRAGRPVVYVEHEGQLSLRWGRRSYGWQSKPRVVFARYFETGENRGTRAVAVNVGTGQALPGSSSRVALLRLFAEEQVLMQVLRALQNGEVNPAPDSRQSRLLGFYLRDATSRLARDGYRLPQGIDVDVAFALSDDASPGWRDALLGRIRQLQLSAELEPHISRNVTNLIKGDLVINKTEQTVQGGSASQVVGNVGSSVSTSQTWQEIAPGIDLTALATQLEKLRVAMRAQATTEDQDAAIGAVAEAAKAAREKQGSKVGEALKKAGKWALDIAVQVGVPLAVEALKKVLAFPG
jgi:hypothetical protein